MKHSCRFDSGLKSSYDSIISVLYSELFDICDINVVGEKCVWLQNKERIDNHNDTVMTL